MSSAGRTVSFFLLAGILAPNSDAESTEKGMLEFSGSYKSQIVSSHTLALFPPRQAYWADLNRLRLKVRGRLAEETSFNVEYDNEIYFGDYLTTNQFVAQKSLSSDTYFGSSYTYIDDASVFARHGLYRAYVDTRVVSTDFRVGRQRIAWGSALFWSPVDIINPFNPTQIDRDQRSGVDGITANWDYRDLSRLSLVYAVHAVPVRATTAVRWQTHMFGYDWGLTAGRFRNDDMASIDFTGQIRKTGVRGEITGSQSPIDGAYTRMVIGADYSFPNSLSLNAEIFFNGQGKSDYTAYNFGRLWKGEIQSLAQRYLGLYVGYEFTPLLKWRNYFINNFDDLSRYYSPELVYSVAENSEMRLGAQMYSGAVGSEFGAFENIYYLQWQIFF